MSEKNGIVGRHINGSFAGVAIVQMDPADDLALQEYKSQHGHPKKDNDDNRVQSARAIHPPQLVED